MSEYAWIITKETDPKLTASLDLPPRKGIMGPQGITKDQIKRLQNGEGHKWRTLDDDNNINYYGLFIGDWESEDGFGPLDDFAGPDSGDIDIQYKQKDGTWKSL